MYVYTICLLVAIATDCFAQDTDLLESSGSIFSCYFTIQVLHDT